MKRKRLNAGFSMAEMILVVGLIAILSGVIFMNVVEHKKNMAFMEANETAKELYLAAQEHLSRAYLQGTFDDVLAYSALNIGARTALDADGNPVLDAEGKPVMELGTQLDGDIYAIYIKAGELSPAAKLAYDTLFPNGAIDAYVQGQNVAIRYDRATYRVLDVFYTKDEYDFNSLWGDSNAIWQGHLDRISGKADISPKGEAYLKNFPADGGKTVIMGYYGTVDVVRPDGSHSGGSGDDPGSTDPDDPRHPRDPDAGKPIVSFSVYNRSVLYALIELNGEYQFSDMKLEITPEGGGDPVPVSFGAAEKLKDADNKYMVILDDVTLNARGFNGNPSLNAVKRAVGCGKNFTAKVTVQARLKDSDPWEPDELADPDLHNSLFADTNGDGSKRSNLSSTVYVENFRHIQNLSKAKNGYSGGVQAEQTQFIGWSTFFTEVSEILSRRGDLSLPTGRDTKETLYQPVNPGDATLTYDGKDNQISGLYTSEGLFGTLANTTTIQNVKMSDTTVTGATSGEVGALIGAVDASGKTIGVTNITLTNTTVTGATDAGGVIGKLSAGNVTVDGVTLKGTTTVSGGTNSNSAVIGAVNDGRLTVKSVTNIISADEYGLITVKGGSAGVVIGSVASGTVDIGGSTIGAEIRGATVGDASTTNAGALIGAVNRGSVTVNKSASYGTSFAKSATESGDARPPVTASGSAGGLIGLVSGSGTTVTLNECAAAHIVGESTTTYAGGLVGRVSGGTLNVTLSYAGSGETGPDGKYFKADASFIANIQGVNAAGLIGNVSGSGTTVTLTNAYSTASAKGTTAAHNLYNKDTAATVTITGDVYGTGKYQGADLKINGGTQKSDDQNPPKHPYNKDLFGVRFPYKTINAMDRNATCDWSKEHMGDWPPIDNLDTLNSGDDLNASAKTIEDDTVRYAWAKLNEAPKNGDVVTLAVSNPNNDPSAEAATAALFAYSYNGSSWELIGSKAGGGAWPDPLTRPASGPQMETSPKNPLKNDDSVEIWVRVPLDDIRTNSSGTTDNRFKTRYVSLNSSLSADKPVCVRAGIDTEPFDFETLREGAESVTIGDDAVALTGEEKTYPNTGVVLFDIRTGEGAELFAAGDAKEAVITNIRHLQNLSTDVSGVGTEFTSATLADDLTWKASADTDAWSDFIRTDGGTASSFYGITNNNLTTFDGGGKTLTNFIIDRAASEESATDNNAALFRTFGKNGGDATTVKNFTLANPKVTSDGDGKAAGLIADAKAAVTVENVDLKMNGSNYPEIKANGTGHAAGLIATASGDVTIQGTGEKKVTLESPVVTADGASGAGNAAGLIADAKAAVTVNQVNLTLDASSSASAVTAKGSGDAAGLIADAAGTVTTQNVKLTLGNAEKNSVIVAQGNGAAAGLIAKATGGDVTATTVELTVDGLDGAEEAFDGVTSVNTNTNSTKTTWDWKPAIVSQGTGAAAGLIAQASKGVTVTGATLTSPIIEAQDGDAAGLIADATDNSATVALANVELKLSEKQAKRKTETTVGGIPLDAAVTLTQIHPFVTAKGSGDAAGLVAKAAGTVNVTGTAKLAAPQIVAEGSGHAAGLVAEAKNVTVNNIEMTKQFSATSVGSGHAAGLVAKASEDVTITTAKLESPQVASSHSSENVSDASALGAGNAGGLVATAKDVTIGSVEIVNGEGIDTVNGDKVPNIPTISAYGKGNAAGLVAEATGTVLVNTKAELKNPTVTTWNAYGSGHAAGLVAEANRVTVHNVKMTETTYPDAAGETQSIYPTIRAHGTGAAGGLIGDVSNGATLTTVRVEETIVESKNSGAAGGLIASASGTTDIDTALVRSATQSVKSGTGAAGGLVGEASGDLTIDNSAATMYVKAGGDAGGLIGTVTGGTANVTESYAGGHTSGGAYQDISDDTSQGRWNVRSTSGAAGGIVGSVGSGATFNAAKSFSAASVSAATSDTESNPAGGIVGTGDVNLESATKIKTDGETESVTGPVYAAGRVNRVSEQNEENAEAPTLSKTTQAGAFAGVSAALTSANAYYLPQVYANGELFKWSETLTTSNIAYRGAASVSGYAQAVSYGDSDAAIAGTKDRNVNLEQRTILYDTSTSAEYPFAIWTKFTFGNAEGDTTAHPYYYGDFEIVENKSSTKLNVKFTYQLQGETDAHDVSTDSAPYSKYDGLHIFPPTLPRKDGYQFDHWELVKTDATGAANVTLNSKEWDSDAGAFKPLGQYDRLDLTRNQIVVLAGYPEPTGGAQITVNAVYRPANSYTVEYWHASDLTQFPDYNAESNPTPDYPTDASKYALLAMESVTNDATPATPATLTPPIPYLAGYDFQGYYDDPSEEGHQIFTATTGANGKLTPASDASLTFTSGEAVKLYARFEKIHYYNITLEFWYKDGEDEVSYSSQIHRQKVGDALTNQPFPLLKTAADIVSVTENNNGTVSAVPNSSVTTTYVTGTGEIDRRNLQVTLPATQSDPVTYKILYASAPTPTEYYVVKHVLHNTSGTVSGADNGDNIPTGASYSATDYETGNNGFWYFLDDDNQLTRNEADAKTYTQHEIPEPKDFTGFRLGTSAQDVAKGFSANSGTEYEISGHAGNKSDPYRITYHYYRERYHIEFDTKSGSPINPITDIQYGTPLFKPEAEGGVNLNGGGYTSTRAGYQVLGSAPYLWKYYRTISSDSAYNGQTRMFKLNAADYSTDTASTGTESNPPTGMYPALTTNLNAMPAMDLEVRGDNGYWTPATSSYHVVFWRQKSTDDVNAAESAKTYDFMGMVTRTGTTDANATLQGGDTTKSGTASVTVGTFNFSLTGCSYNATKTEAANNGKTIAGDGSTVLNVYYDRDVHTLYFYVREQAYQYTPTTATTGTLYGWIESASQYVTLSRSPVGRETYVYEALPSTDNTTSPQYDAAGVELVYAQTSSNDRWTAYTYTQSYSNQDGKYYIIDNTTNLFSDNEVQLYRRKSDNTWWRNKTGGQYSNQYTGKRYTRNNRSEYTGEKYMSAGSGSFYVPESLEGINKNTLYGKQDDGYFPLTYAPITGYQWQYADGTIHEGTRYKRTTVTEYDWTYTLNGVTHTYDGVRYTRSGGNNNVWNRKQSITALYGQHIGDRFNESFFKRKSWVDCNTTIYSGLDSKPNPFNTQYPNLKHVYDAIVLSVDKMTDTDIHFCQYDEGDGCFIYYYLENVTDARDTVAEAAGKTQYYYSGKWYTLDKTIELDGGYDWRYGYLVYLTYNEEFHDVEGFTQGLSSPAFGTGKHWISDNWGMRQVNNSDTEASIGSDGKNYLYYTRNSYTLSIYDTETNTVIGTVSVPYEAKLESYVNDVKRNQTGGTFTTDAGTSYQWNGKYYSDQACTTPMYVDTETMPSNNFMVYLKFNRGVRTVKFQNNDPVRKVDATGVTYPNQATEYVPADINLYYGETVENRTTTDEDTLGPNPPAFVDAQKKITDEYKPSKAGYNFGGWYYTDASSSIGESKFYSAMPIMDKEDDDDKNVPTVTEYNGENLAYPTLILYPMWISTEVQTAQVTVKCFQMVDGEKVYLDFTYNGTECGADSGYTHSVEVNKRFTALAPAITGYEVKPGPRTITVSATESENVIEIEYESAPWSYQVEYWVRLRNIERKTGESWLTEYNDTDDMVYLKAYEETVVSSPKDDNGKMVDSVPLEFAPTDEYAGYLPIGYRSGGEIAGDEITTGNPQDSSSGAKAIHSDRSAIVSPGEDRSQLVTVRFYMEADPTLIQLDSESYTYDGDHHARDLLIADEAWNEDTKTWEQTIKDPPNLKPPAGVSYKAYRQYWDLANLTADGKPTKIDAPKNAGTYAETAYIVALHTHDGRTDKYLLWKSADYDKNESYLTISPRPITLKSLSKTDDTGKTPLDIPLKAPIVYVEEGAFVTDDAITDGTVTINDAGEEDASGDKTKDKVNSDYVIFAVDAFRRNPGVTSNVFDVKLLDALAKNYAVTKEYGTLTVN